jgi:protein subunit release factor B
LHRAFIWYLGEEGIEGSRPEIVSILGGRANVVLFAVSEEKNRWLQEKMEALGIHEKDIEEKFIRSSGRGGQKVNKTSTCVYLRHIPTGFEIKCMKERSQSLNRFLARRELVRRVEEGFGRPTSEDILKDRVRRKKSKRKKRARLKYGKVAGPEDQKIT